jgi:hypothetical protein
MLISDLTVLERAGIAFTLLSFLLGILEVYFSLEHW